SRTRLPRATWVARVGTASGLPGPDGRRTRPRAGIRRPARRPGLGPAAATAAHGTSTAPRWSAGPGLDGTAATGTRGNGTGLRARTRARTQPADGAARLARRPARWMGPAPPDAPADAPGHADDEAARPSWPRRPTTGTSPAVRRTGAGKASE